MAENRLSRAWFILAFSQFVSWFDFANMNHKCVVLIILVLRVWFHLIHTLGDQFGFGFANYIWGDSNPAVILYKTLKFN